MFTYEGTASMKKMFPKRCLGISYSGGKGIEQDKSKSLAWAVVADVLADSKEDADISYQQMHKLLPLMNPNPEDVSKAKKLALELLDSLKPKSGD